MGTLKIKVKNERLRSFKRHLEEEHPSTRGKIKISKKMKCKKKGSMRRKMLKGPDFEQNAKDFMQPL